MMKRVGFALCILCLVLCVMMTVVADDAEAQDDDDKKKDADGPTKLQMIVGIGSIFVMIAVVKFL